MKNFLLGVLTILCVKYAYKPYYYYTWANLYLENCIPTEVYLDYTYSCVYDNMPLRDKLAKVILGSPSYDLVKGKFVLWTY